jgi:hypothetical protein
LRETDSTKLLHQILACINIVAVASDVFTTDVSTARDMNTYQVIKHKNHLHKSFSLFQTVYEDQDEQFHCFSPFLGSCGLVLGKSDCFAYVVVMFSLAERVGAGTISNERQGRRTTQQ